MPPDEVQHTLDPGARLLFAELQLKGGTFNGRGHNLPFKFVKLPPGNVEVGSRVFVLESVTRGSALQH